MSNRKGYRGYIGSRAYRSDRVPQHVQNLVVRDFCQRNGFTYLLSATEYAMPACYLMLEEVVHETLTLNGVVLYSIFMLPQRAERRRDLCRRILDAGATIHGAVENISIRNEEDLDRAEEIFLVDGIAAAVPSSL